MIAIAVLAAGMAALAVGAFYVWFDVQRVEQLSSQRLQNAVSQHLLASTLELELPFAQRVIRPALRGFLRRLGGASPGRNMEKLRQQLLMAGSPMGLEPLDFLGLRVLVAVLGTAILCLILAIASGSVARSLLAGLAGAILFSELPVYWLRRKMKARQKEIGLALADALDMLTVCVDAGLGIESAFKRIGDSWNNALAYEFRRVVVEIGLGATWREAMRSLVYRTGVAELSALVAVLLQAEQLGFSISDTLHTQSNQMRIRRRQKAQEAARGAPLKMLIPMVFFIMPATFAVVIGPAVPSIIEAFGAI